MEVPAVYTFAPSSRMQTKFIPCYRTYMHICIQELASYSGSRTLEDSNCQISVYPAWSSTNLSWTLLAEHLSRSLELVEQRWGWCVHHLPLLSSGYHSHNFAQCHAISNNRLKVPSAKLTLYNRSKVACVRVQQFPNQRSSSNTRGTWELSGTIIHLFIITRVQATLLLLSSLQLKNGCMSNQKPPTNLRGAAAILNFLYVINKS